jgi:hypothetical protein
MWGPTDRSWFIIPSDHKYVHQKSYPIAIRGVQATYLGATSFSDIWQWTGSGTFFLMIGIFATSM